MRPLDDVYVPGELEFPQAMLELECEPAADDIPIDVDMSHIELYPANNELLARFDGALDDSEDQLMANLSAVHISSESNDNGARGAGNSSGSEYSFIN